MPLNPLQAGTYMHALLNRSLQRTLHPNWMTAPDMWMWQTSSVGGQGQGFGRNWREHVGLANLLWLTMPAGLPPDFYDARLNSLYCQVLTRARMVPDLLDSAELLTLEQFVQKWSAPRHSKWALVPELVQRAKGKLNAHAR